MVFDFLFVHLEDELIWICSWLDLGIKEETVKMTAAKQLKPAMNIFEAPPV